MVRVASNHVVVGERLEWEDVGNARLGSGLGITDELVATGGDGRHDAGRS